MAKLGSRRARYADEPDGGHWDCGDYGKKHPRYDSEAAVGPANGDKQLWEHGEPEGKQLWEGRQRRAHGDSEEAAVGDPDWSRQRRHGQHGRRHERRLRHCGHGGVDDA